MQLRCYSCHTPFTVGRDIVHNSLNIMEEDELVHFDFRVSEFADLYKNLMLYRLETLAQKNPLAFERSLRILQEGNKRQINRRIRNLVSRPLGLPDDYELKIPVAIPPESFNYVKN